MIEAALKKLDVPQRQVLIQLTIAEVTLTDDLTFGIDWLFRGGAPSGRGSGGNFNSTKTPFNPQPTPTATGTTTAASTAALVLQSGFNYILNNAMFPGGVQAALHLLDSYGSTRGISNPHLSALDNQKATIKVGDRIPINQQTFVGGTTGTVNNAVTTTSQYIDTGVLVQVTPHINTGGLVTLEVNAEVSNPGNPANPGDEPPISPRSVRRCWRFPPADDSHGRPQRQASKTPRMACHDLAGAVWGCSAAGTQKNNRSGRSFSSRRQCSNRRAITSVSSRI